MGMLVDGKWTDDDGKSRGTGGKFDHLPTSFREFITADGSSGFPAEAGRYTLFVTRTCPWAHRTILFRHLKGLNDVIDVVFGGSGDQGYQIAEKVPFTVPGTDYQATYLHEIYSLANPNYTGRVTVPTLWDAKKKTVLNNESSEIIRMINSEFGAFTDDRYDYYPEDLRAVIDPINDLVYDNVNNGVYQAGFSRSQEAYEEAYDNLFDAFDKLEDILAERRYLAGDRITEADWRLFPTLFRFDTVYHYAFKCNKKHLYQYPNMWNYTRDLYQKPGIADWCFLDAAKQGYWSGPKVNATGTIPKGPDIDFSEPHDRERLPEAA